jgi:hypothetical protein
MIPAGTTLTNAVPRVASLPLGSHGRLHQLPIADCHHGYYPRRFDHAFVCLCTPRTHRPRSTHRTDPRYTTPPGSTLDKIKSTPSGIGVSACPALSLRVSIMLSDREETFFKPIRNPETFVEFGSRMDFAPGGVLARQSPFARCSGSSRSA